MKLTLDDLRFGRRAQVKPSEYAQLKGCSQATLSRKRWDGTGIPYERDSATGRIYYSALDVLADLEAERKHISTSEYQHAGNERMATARAAKSAQSVDS